MTEISWAQNGEDVILNRALRDVEKGFYIDVGSQHPVKHSVNLLFYRKGWHGIHVECAPAYAELLREHRPDETVIEAAAYNSTGSAYLNLFEYSGASTLDDETASRARMHLSQKSKIEVKLTTLDDIFSRITESEIHWLKIDVEGTELQVLEGWKDSPRRPWIVVIESIDSFLNTPNEHNFEHILIEKDYQKVLFDGVNTYYVHMSQSHLSPLLSYSTCGLDNFVNFGNYTGDIHGKFVEEKTIEKDIEERGTYTLERRQQIEWLTKQLRELKNEFSLILGKNSRSKLKEKLAIKPDLPVPPVSYVADVSKKYLPAAKTFEEKMITPDSDWISQCKELSNEDFVDISYRRWLMRDPDAEGRAHFLGLLRWWVSREKISQKIYNSAESERCRRLRSTIGFKTIFFLTFVDPEFFVDASYSLILQRLPEPEALASVNPEMLTKDDKLNRIGILLRSEEAAHNNPDLNRFWIRNNWAMITFLNTFQMD